MLLLTTVTDVVQLITSAAQALHVHVSYVDNAAGTITPGRQFTSINTAATTGVSGTVPSSTQRNVQTIVARNAGAASNDVTVRLTDGTTPLDVFKATIAPGEMLSYLDGIGFRVLDATGAVKETATAPGRLLRTAVLTSGVTWQCPSDVTRIFARLLGGGGGGAGAAFTASNASAGGGGGSGGYLEALITVVPGTTYTIAIGSAGSAGTAGANNGGAGGNTTLAVGATTYAAGGGGGGVAQAAGTTALGSLGGAGGTATNGDLNSPGSRGVRGLRFSGTAGVSGAGASSEYGGGGSEAVAQGAGGAGSGFGAGGGGALGLTATAAGGAGTAGVILLDQYA